MSQGAAERPRLVVRPCRPSDADLRSKLEVVRLQLTSGIFRRRNPFDLNNGRSTGGDWWQVFAMEYSPVPQKKLRRTQGERSELMRKTLLDAAVAVLKTRGLAGFRTAEVVEIAGVSKGALLHHFPTKVDLVAGAFEWLREGTDVSAQHFQRRETLEETVQDVIAESRAFFFGASFPATLDVAVTSARTPELRDTIFHSVRGLRQHTEERWAERLMEYGMSRTKAEDLVLLINTVFRGVAVRSLWEKDKDLLERPTAILAEMIDCYLKQ